jgi:hypothetical protein
MPGDGTAKTTGGAAAGAFGSCCGELKDAMAGEGFEPLITLGEHGVLYMAVGLFDLEDEESGMVDHPLLFCPFCGTKLQSADEVRAKIEKDATAGGS